MFFDLFNPNNRHRTEELRRLENTREEEAQGEPGRGPIDLSSGTVLIRVPTKEPEPSAAADGGESAEDEAGAADDADEGDGKNGADAGAAASAAGDGGA